MGIWDDFDFTDFWDDCDYSLKHYVEPAPDDALIASIEAELGGYRLPAAYVELMRRHNGGMVRRCCYPMTEPTPWAEDHICITGFYAIGRSAGSSLCGDSGSTFMQEMWGYPAIGVGIADTPSAGHEQIMLDYRACGKQGEPQVVHVDQECDYVITVVAPDFATFIRGLVDEEVFNRREEERQEAIVTVERGTLSPLLKQALAAAGDRLPDGERILRTLGQQIVEEKGFFALHADARSLLIYDLIFWLCSQLRTMASFEAFLKPPEGESHYVTPCYEWMIVFGLTADPYGFCTGGYAPDFLRDWWEARLAAGVLAPAPGGWRFTPQAEAALLRQLAVVIAPSEY